MLCEALVGEVCEGRPSPEVQRATDGRGRLLRIASGALLTPRLEKVLEPTGVQLLSRYDQSIAVAMRLEGQRSGGVGRVVERQMYPILD